MTNGAACARGCGCGCQCRWVCMGGCGGRAGGVHARIAVPHSAMPMCTCACAMLHGATYSRAHAYVRAYHVAWRHIQPCPCVRARVPCCMAPQMLLYPCAHAHTCARLPALAAGVRMWTASKGARCMQPRLRVTQPSAAAFWRRALMRVQATVLRCGAQWRGSTWRWWGCCWRLGQTQVGGMLLASYRSCVYYRSYSAAPRGFLP